jgi:hypothetical protein
VPFDANNAGEQLHCTTSGQRKHKQKHNNKANRRAVAVLAAGWRDCRQLAAAVAVVFAFAAAFDDDDDDVVVSARRAAGLVNRRGLSQIVGAPDAAGATC